MVSYVGNEIQIPNVFYRNDRSRKVNYSTISFVKTM